MAAPKFTKQELDHYNDRISNVLESERSRNVLETYLTVSRQVVLSKALRAWKEAYRDGTFDEDLIEEIDGFNLNPLYSLSEGEHKAEYVRQECCRLLERIRPAFMEYLAKYHR